jgi:cell wall-associated NlpC family hydrolase
MKQLVVTCRIISICFLGILLLSSCASTRKYNALKEQKRRSRVVASTSTATKTKARPAKIISASTKNVLRSKVVDKALTYQGINYVYGGKTPKGFDCSGFTAYVFNQLGLSVKGASYHQATQGTRKSIKNAKPGDLVFFETKGKVVHVSIVVDKSDDELWVVHSTSSRGVVKDEILHSSYWKPRISSVRDVIE